LNGLSSLISRRSAISRRMRAIARLSNLEALGLDMVVEQPRAALRERVGDRGSRAWRTVANHAPAAARAAHLAGHRTGGLRARHQIVDRRRRDARRQALAVFPLDANLAADFIPVAALERRSHRHRRIANPLEAIEDVPIAVDMTLDDLPVVGAGSARRAGVRQHDAALELARIDVEHHTGDPGDAELDGRDAAVERRTIVLHAGWDPDRLAFDVHRHLQD